MEKVEISNVLSFCALAISELGFDAIARKRVREQLGLDPSESALGAEEDEFLMFLLYRSILY